MKETPVVYILAYHGSNASMSFSHIFMHIISIRQVACVQNNRFLSHMAVNTTCPVIFVVFGSLLIGVTSIAKSSCSNNDVMSIT